MAEMFKSKLASCFHQFGWDMGTISSTTAGQIRHGKRIPIQATAAGRRKRGKSRGKGKAVAGRPAAGAASSHLSGLSLTHSKQLVLAGTVCLYATLPRERDCIP